MRFWKVKIRCWAEWKKAKQRYVEVTVLVQALDPDAAIVIAKKHAESTAEIGPKWIGFDFVECASAELPLTI